MTFVSPAGYADVARFSWATNWNDRREPLAGEDFADLAPDGRIRRIRRMVSFDGPASPPRLPTAPRRG